MIIVTRPTAVAVETTVATAPAQVVDTDWQVGINGLVLGPGTDYRLADISRVLGRTVAHIDGEQSVRHGVRPGRYRLEKMSKVIEGSIGDGSVSGFSPATVAQAWDALATAWVPTDHAIPLTYQLPGLGRRRLVGRCGEVDPDLADLAVGLVRFAVEFVVLDPRQYSEDEQSAGAALAVSTGGFELPFQLPFSLGLGSAGTLSAPNSGSVPAPWTGRLMGPINSPTITHVESGRHLTLAGLVVAGGDWVDFDSETHLVLFRGEGSLRSYLTADSSWFELAPGANTVGLGSPNPGDGTLSVFWRHAWA